MRIDRSDLADVPSSADMARCVRSAPDDPDAVGHDQSQTVGGDGPPDSSLASLDSALPMDRAVAYRAAVDAYRQYAIGPGSHLVDVEDRLRGKDGDYGVAGTTPVLVHDAFGPGYGIIGTAAEYVLTGARGPASGREFDPETAGGPIQQFDAGKERITNEGVQE